ncbi:MAG: hypothetical protein HY731_04990, partial [Candidatus Tectomicrobia bacterium]|nr:hypothetical protein [Candidatus Tectomicrobia bacterium]
MDIAYKKMTCRQRPLGGSFIRIAFICYFPVLFIAAILLLLSSSFAISATKVTVSGPGGSASQLLPDEGGSFDVNIPLNRNAINKITVTATDANDNTASQELQVTQVSLDAIVVSKVTAERLSVQEVEALVSEGVIQLDDPANYHVSTFDIVLTIAKEPVPIRVPIVLPKEEPQGWERVKLPSGGNGSGGRPKPRPVEIVVFEEFLPAPRVGLPPVSIPGVIVIEGNIKSLKEFFNVRLLLMNTSGIFTLSDVTA